MSETLDILAAVGPNIDSGLYEDAVHVLVKSAWRNSDEDTMYKTSEARAQYFHETPPENALVVVGHFDGEPVSAAIGTIETWHHPGNGGEYLGYLGKQALELSLFGVRVPYRKLGFGTQTLAAVGHVAHVNDCTLIAMIWADFQWEWFQVRGGFEGKFGLIAESVRSLPMPAVELDLSRLKIAG